MNYKKGKENMILTVNSKDLKKEDWKHSQITEYILKLNDDEFWNLINVRLHLPTYNFTIKEALNDIDIEYWHLGHLIEEIFLLITKKREVITYNNKKITIYKYYNQALRMWKWIPISKPKAKFTINISDLTSRIYCELRNLDRYVAQYVLKESVKRIFETIDFKFYHEHIEDNLEVTLDK